MPDHKWDCGIHEPSGRGCDCGAARREREAQAKSADPLPVWGPSPQEAEIAALKAREATLIRRAQLAEARIARVMALADRMAAGRSVVPTASGPLVAAAIRTALQGETP